jgi:L-2-hydroxycarboxylate dehydrogenase (NAD+)
MAREVAQAYVVADLYGLASHGVMRVLRIQDGIDAGTHFPGNRPKIVKDNPASALVDGCSSLGVAVGLFATRLAIEKARRNGIACVGVFNSNHFGIAGYYVRKIAEARMIGFTFCNASPALAAFGGRRPVLGTNPIAIAAPTRGKPIALDLSPSSIVRGKVLEAQRRGQPLEPGVAVDADGNPTTDPTAALAGAFLPYGGQQAYKTYGLALMIDVLCGPLVSAAFTDRVTGSADTKVDCNKGDFYVAIDVGQLRDYEAYLEDMDAVVQSVKESGSEVLLPGEREHQREEGAGGVLLLDDDMISQLAGLGRRYGLELDTRP